MVQPFRAAVPQAVLDDLRERLERTRLPDAPPGTGWELGTDRAFLERLLARWRDGFDWRAVEARLNVHPQYVVELDAQPIHFLHLRRGSGRLGLLLTHGWPGSVLEFLDVLEALAEDVDVVVPSLPGYGFSGPTRERGVDVERIAGWWARLMTDVLGYERWVAQGGDWGAAVTTRLGLRRPPGLAAVHLNMVMLPPHPADRADPSPAEQEYLRQAASWRALEAGYHHLQSTRPQTAAFGLADSPSGLAAWICEKFRAWSDCDGDMESVFTLDQLLANLTLYWVTGTIASSMRLYAEERLAGFRLAPGERVTIPTAVAAYPKELVRPPREWAERTMHVVRWTDLERGGHFAAMEQPALFSDDVRAFVAALPSAARRG